MAEGREVLVRWATLAKEGYVIVRLPRRWLEPGYVVVRRLPDGSIVIRPLKEASEHGRGEESLECMQRG